MGLVQQQKRNHQSVTTQGAAAFLRFMALTLLLLVAPFQAEVFAAKPTDPGGGNGGGNSGGGNGGGGNGGGGGDATADFTDALRFLAQTTWGPNDDSLAQLTGADADLTGSEKEAFLAAQFGLNTSTFPQPDYTPGVITSFRPTQRRFFYNALHEPDQLRQRVAFFLSQLWVVSEREVNGQQRMQPYVEALHDVALGNYRDIMEALTLHPAMGNYLNMANSRADNGRIPNENFSRELLQLFTIGPLMLNTDGSPATEKRTGNQLPSYTEDDVIGLAYALSGWTYPAREGATDRCSNPGVFEIGPMVPSGCTQWHSAEAKILFNGELDIPSGLGAREELSIVLDYLFDHPNTGPFLAARLIQHFVTSNPTPKYVSAVAKAFSDNGAGVRGDMQAVLTTLFTHREASTPAEDMMAGRLREPVVFMNAALRGFNATIDPLGTSNELRNYASAMEQDPWRAPSVFNYFHLAHGTFHGDHGNHADGPEFAIHTQTGSLSRADFIDELSRNSLGNVSLDFTALRAMSDDTVALMDAVASRLRHHALTDADRDVIAAALDQQTDGSMRVRMAIYLIANTRAWVQGQ